MGSCTSGQSGTLCPAQHVCPEARHKPRCWQLNVRLMGGRRERKSKIFFLKQNKNITTNVLHMICPVRKI